MKRAEKVKPVVQFSIKCKYGVIDTWLLNHEGKWVKQLTPNVRIIANNPLEYHDYGRT